MSIDFIKSLYYEILSYFVPQKIEYKITGKCKKCGRCCKEIRSYGLKNEKELKIMQFFLPYYKRFYITGTDENNNIILSCKFLLDSGLCGKYKTRPLICKNYPEKSNHFQGELLEGCGFKILRKNFKDYL